MAAKKQLNSAIDRGVRINILRALAAVFLSNLCGMTSVSTGRADGLDEKKTQ